MASLRTALAQAIMMCRPAAVKWTLYRGHEAVELSEEAFNGRCDFVIEENGSLPLPQNRDASIALASLIYEGIGYVGDEVREPKGMPKFLKESIAKRPRVEDDDPFDPVEPPKKKLKLKTKKTGLTKRR
jgi:hypothetical protein